MVSNVFLNNKGKKKNYFPDLKWLKIKLAMFFSPKESNAVKINTEPLGLPGLKAEEQLTYGAMKSCNLLHGLY